MFESKQIFLQPLSTILNYDNKSNELDFQHCKEGIICMHDLCSLAIALSWLTPVIEQRVWTE